MKSEKFTTFLPKNIEEFKILSSCQLSIPDKLAKNLNIPTEIKLETSWLNYCWFNQGINTISIINALTPNAENAEAEVNNAKLQISSVGFLILGVLFHNFRSLKFKGFHHYLQLNPHFIHTPALIIQRGGKEISYGPLKLLNLSMEDNASESRKQDFINFHHWLIACGAPLEQTELKVNLDAFPVSFRYIPFVRCDPLDLNSDTFSIQALVPVLDIHFALIQRLHLQPNVWTLNIRCPDLERLLVRIPPTIIAIIWQYTFAPLLIPINGYTLSKRKEAEVIKDNDKDNDDDKELSDTLDKLMGYDENKLSKWPMWFEQPKTYDQAWSIKNWLIYFIENPLTLESNASEIKKFLCGPKFEEKGETHLDQIRANRMLEAKKISILSSFSKGKINIHNWATAFSQYREYKNYDYQEKISDQLMLNILDFKEIKNYHSEIKLDLKASQLDNDPNTQLAIKLDVNYFKEFIPRLEMIKHPAEHQRIITPFIRCLYARTVSLETLAVDTSNQSPRMIIPETPFINFCWFLIGRGYQPMIATFLTLSHPVTTPTPLPYGETIATPEIKIYRLGFLLLGFGRFIISANDDVSIQFLQSLQKLLSEKIINLNEPAVEINGERIFALALLEKITQSYFFTEEIHQAGMNLRRNWLVAQGAIPEEKHIKQWFSPSEFKDDEQPASLKTFTTALKYKTAFIWQPYYTERVPAVRAFNSMLKQPGV